MSNTEDSTAARKVGHAGCFGIALLALCPSFASAEGLGGSVSGTDNDIFRKVAHEHNETIRFCADMFSSEVFMRQCEDSIFELKEMETRAKTEQLLDRLLDE